jgi:hypothetical protein
MSNELALYSALLTDIKIRIRHARDLRNELLERKGFAKLNIGYMIRFAREYDAAVILQQAVAKLSVPTNTTATEFLPQAVAKSVNLKQRLMEWAREEDEP